MQFQKIYLLVPDPLNFADARIFFCNKSASFGQDSAFTQSNSMRNLLETF